MSPISVAICSGVSNGAIMFISFGSSRRALQHIAVDRNGCRRSAGGPLMVSQNLVHQGTDGVRAAGVISPMATNPAR